jgi:hypothetical protein
MQSMGFIMHPCCLAANTISSTLIMLTASQRGCTINTIYCTYSKLPTEDEQFIYMKHVEDIYWNKFKKKVHLVGSYYANLSQCAVHIMSNLESYHPIAVYKPTRS